MVLRLSLQTNGRREEVDGWDSACFVCYDRKPGRFICISTELLGM